jgi:hypothetical protein
MLLFLDTEFTTLDRRLMKLLSVGIVSEDGRAEFYAELPEGASWARSECSEFVLQQVLPLLEGGKHRLAEDELAQALHAWLEARGEGCTLACDSELDHQLLRRVLGGRWPVNLAPGFHNLGGLLDTRVFEHAADSYFSNAGVPRHHALHDARANRKGWLAAMAAARSPFKRRIS